MFMLKMIIYIIYIVTRKVITMFILIAIIFIFLIYIIIQYNKFVSMKKNIERSKSGIDVYLTQRFDLIPNLVECAKQYSVYENSVLDTITQNRSKYMETKNLKIGANLNNQFNSILLQGESYPELNANEQFLYLQKSLTKLENQLQAARRIYNIDVTKYNTALYSFPSSIIAKIFGFKEAELFEADNEVTEVPKI